MVKGSLVKDYIKVGEKLIDLAKGAGLAPKLAVWVYESETDRWHILLALDEVATLGMRPVLWKLQRDVLGKHENELWPIELEDIDLASPNAPLVKALALIQKSGAGLISRPMRFTGMRVADRFLEDALLYPPATTFGY